MATLRQLRTRVSSIRNIQKMTNAMQLVAAARMRRAQNAILAARPYALQIDRILRQLGTSVDAAEHPLLSERPIEREAILVVTADRGLCGAFNANICRRAAAELDQKGDTETTLITVGRKGRDYFRNRGYSIHKEHSDLFRDLVFSQAVTVAADATGLFMSGAVDRVSIVYSEFKSVVQQTPEVAQLLPIVPGEVDEEESVDFAFEPEPVRLLEALVPRHVNFQIWRALLESNAGELAARMTAMDNATKNAGDLIEDLTREVNKVRQASITLELMDIIGGAEAVAQ